MSELAENIRYYSMIIIFVLGLFAIDNYRGIVRTGFDGGDGHEITLYNNKSAADPTYEQAMSFVREDKTNTKKYSSQFLCGDFSEEFHNNAEAQGLKCGWVFVDFISDSEDHACNVFNTSDRGQIFVDCTSGDALVKIEEGEIYQPKSFEPMGTVLKYRVYW